MLKLTDSKIYDNNNCCYATTNSKLHLKKLNIRIETNLMYYYNRLLRGFQILNKQVHIIEKYMYGRYFFKI